VLPQVEDFFAVHNQFMQQQARVTATAGSRALPLPTSEGDGNFVTNVQEESFLPSHPPPDSSSQGDSGGASMHAASSPLRGAALRELKGFFERYDPRGNFAGLKKITDDEGVALWTRDGVLDEAHRRLLCERRQKVQDARKDIRKDISSSM
jgi:hypothetical protein